MADMECPMSVSNLLSSHLICLHTEISEYLYQKYQSIYTLLYRKYITISLDYTGMMKGKGLR